MTRRTFCRGAAASGAMIIPRYVLGGPGFTAPSDRLSSAGIGVGGQGAADLSQMEDESIVALSDVD